MNCRNFLLTVVCLGACSSAFCHEEAEDTVVSVKTVEYHPSRTIVMYSLIPRGWWRIGDCGYGKFYGFSFGRTNYHGTNETVITDQDVKLLKVSGSLNNISKCDNEDLKKFESVALYLDEKLRKLVRVELITPVLSSKQIRKCHKEVKSDIEYMLGMNFNTMKNEFTDADDIVSHFEAEDAKFKAMLIVRRINLGEQKLEVSVTSKSILKKNNNRIVKPFESSDDDLLIDVDDL